MHPDLFLVAYRRQDHELQRRLEQRRVAEERGLLGAPSPSLRDPVARARPAVAAVRAGRAHLGGLLARTARSGGASLGDGCCSPA